MAHPSDKALQALHNENVRLGLYEQNLNCKSVQARLATAWGYVKAEQNLKLMPREATPEMLKAMDECSTEGYDERLYAGHAASVYMAAWDAAPTTPQRKPLTDEQVHEIAKQYALNLAFPYGGKTTPEMFARAIEAAHGIKE